MPRVIAALLSLSLLATPCFAQEKTASGLELEAPRAMIDQPVRAPKAMISSVNELATDAGLAVLKKGGNAVDAAVAVAVALAVVHPEAGNLGGSGHMLIRMADGRTAAIDYSGMAPAATDSHIAAKELSYGYRSVAVPGTPAGIGMAHERFGKLPWKECLEPARVLASKGFPAPLRMEIMLNLEASVMKQFPESAKVLLHGSDKPVKQGELIVQPDLAATITRLQKFGWQEFYTGKTAELIAADMAAHGGWITQQDMRDYKATWHEPIHTTYRGYQILTVPPSASGGLNLAVSLNVLETQPMPLGTEGSSHARRLQVEALRRGFETIRDLNQEHHDRPLDELTSKAFAQKLAASIPADGATPPPVLQDPPHDSKETTHFSVVDADGNIVTNTYTLSGFYGSKVIAKGTGIMLNNHMSTFNRKPGSRDYLSPHMHYITPMTGTILLHPDGSPWAAFGSPGGGTIPSTVFQLVTNLVDFKMSLRDAVEYPRINYDLTSNQIEAEPGALVTDVVKNLQAMGYKINPKLRSQGDVNAIMIEPGTGWKLGSSDGRRGGVAKGY